MIIFLSIVAILWVWLIIEFKNAPRLKTKKDERIDYDNDRIYSRMMNFADYLENKPNNIDITDRPVIKPYLDNKQEKKELGKRKYI